MKRTRSLTLLMGLWACLLLGLALPLLLAGGASANGANGTAVGSPTYAAGQTGFGQALTLTNSTSAGTQYVTIPDPGFSASATWTEEGFFQAQDTGLRVIAALAKPDGSENSWFLTLQSGGGVLLRVNGMTTQIGNTTSYAGGLWHHWAVVMSGGTSVGLFIDGALIGTATGTYAPVSGTTDYIGGYSAPATYFFGQIDEVRISNTARYTAAFTPPSAPFANTDAAAVALYHFDGNALDSSNPTTATAQALFGVDSFTYGVNASAGIGTATGTTYPGVALGYLGAAWEGYNAGVSGQQISTALTAIQSQVIGHFDSAVSLHVACVLGGINDLGATTQTPAQVYATIVSYHQAVHAAGGRTVAFTVPHFNYGAGSAAGTYPYQGSSAYDPRADALNTLIRAGWRGWADALCDIAADTRLATETNATYFNQSNGHPTDAGYAVIAGYAAGGVQQAASSVAAASALTLTITHNTSGFPVLTWVPDPLATAYKVERSVDGVNYQVIATVAAPTLTYTDTAEPAGTVRYHILPVH